MKGEFANVSSFVREQLRALIRGTTQQLGSLGLTVNL